MLFNSYEFLILLAIVYIGYSAMRRSHEAQNALLLVASYVFYAAWDWRFLSLIWLSTVLDFVAGRAIAASQDRARRRRYLLLSIVANLSLLVTFKYFNFFADGFASMLTAVGLTTPAVTLEIVLPVGISFYTFQTMSYTIDIYRRELQPTPRLADFALFVAFFPQLVAGPIERARHLLPQITHPRNITPGQIHAGIHLLIWGFFKKVVIADNLAPIADHAFEHCASLDSAALAIGALAFAFQIYCDFSGYSDIARGVCKTLGFDLLLNFKIPYFARNPSDYWARWHVSLSSWFKDYVFLPLQRYRHHSYRNILLVFVLSGLWHGASMQFIFWGLYHGIVLVAYYAWIRRWPPRERSHRTVEVGKGIAMFTVATFGWILFRSSSLEEAWVFATRMLTASGPVPWGQLYSLVFFVAPLVAVQVVQHWRDDLLAISSAKPWIRVPVHTLLLCGILIFGVRQSATFLYFQF